MFLKISEQGLVLSRPTLGSDLNTNLDLTPGEQLPASIGDWLTRLRIENQPA
jgi:hypothetical protein